MTYVSMFRGMDYIIEISIVDTDGTPTNLTNCDLYLVAKKDYTSEPSMLIEGVIDSPETGDCYFRVTSSDSYITPARYYFYVLLIINEEGEEVGRHRVYSDELLIKNASDSEIPSEQEGE